MVPKFKGDTDDWLDDEGMGSLKRSLANKKKALGARALGLPPEDSNAVVSEVFPNLCRVKLDSEGSDLICSYRRASVVGKDKGGKEKRERSPVAVGDRVLAQKGSSSTGVIEGVCARRNSLSRVAPGRSGRAGRDATQYHHIIAANVDFLVVVASVREPAFSAGLVDRFLVAAEAEGIPSLLCISKVDLWNREAGENHESDSPWDIYRSLGYSLHEVSVKDEFGLERLEKKIEGKTAVFCGHSGVGKTSLLRTLLKSDIGRVGQVNEATGKGRHTTTGAILLGGPNGSQWIDTPGVREFGLTSVKPETLAHLFPEFRNIPCQHPNCLHRDEDGCAAHSHFRYATYRRILESLIAGEN